MAKKEYVITVLAANSRGQKIEKQLKFVKGASAGSVSVPAHFLGQVAFHVDDNNGIIYDCYAKMVGMIGGKSVVKNGLAENSNGDFFIIEANEKVEGDTIVSQSFDVFKAVNA